jgi:hypothetical protein
MSIFQHIKQHKIAVVTAIISYVLLYGVARDSQMLIHRVSHAGDVYYHSVDTSERYLWSPLGVLGPINYIVFSPLRWTEAFTWRFIPRHYEIH